MTEVISRLDELPDDLNPNKWHCTLILEEIAQERTVENESQKPRKLPEDTEESRRLRRELEKRFGRGVV